MKRILTLLFLLISLTQVNGYKVLYSEQFYRLYHEHLYQYPQNSYENIKYLEHALGSDFANPQNALAKIENKEQWEKYRYLFRMHVNLKLVDSYLQIARKYDKRKAYFYNKPWKEMNLKSLEMAEGFYEFAKHYWKDAVMWSNKAAAPEFAWMFLEDIQAWEDESFQIQEGLLNYERIINKHLARLRQVRADFEAMDDSTY